MIRSLMKLCVIGAIASTATAQQPQVTAKFDMPWSLISVTQIDALRGPSSTGTYSSISKQTGVIDLNVDFTTLAASPTGILKTVTFPGQGTAWTITALRLTVCAGSQTLICEQPMRLRYSIPPYTVRAGHPAVVGLTLLPAKQGSFAVQEDALTTTGPITPPPPPPTPQPPPVTLPTGSLVTSEGTWVLSSPDPNCEGGIKNAVQLNGVSKGAADEIRVCTGVLYARDGTTWYQGSGLSTCGGSGWVRQTPPC